MSNNKKKAKNAAHAAMVWERDQLTAALVAEKITKAMAVIEQYGDELTEEQKEQIVLAAEQRSAELREFTMKARNKYIAKMAALGLEPTFTKEA